MPNAPKLEIYSAFHTLGRQDTNALVVATDRIAARKMMRAEFGSGDIEIFDFDVPDFQGDHEPEVARAKAATQPVIIVYSEGA